MGFENKKVLVTGAAGFIGSQLVERLVNAGASVRAFIRYYSNGSIGNLGYSAKSIISSIEIVRGDLRDADAVRRAAREVDTIFHLGALIAIPYSYVNPREVIDTNVGGTLNVLAAARDVGVRRVVCTSTSEVYGTARYVPIDEAHPMQGQSPYSASKIGADRVAESFYRAFDVPVSILRPFNTYGPRQSARAIIPAIIIQALTSDRLRLGSLTPTRDLTYVDDTVDGFIRIADCDAALGEEVNLGTGTDVSIGNLVERIERIMGRPLPVELDEQRVRPQKSEVMRLLSSNAKAKQLMGWSPRIDLDEGLARTLEWIRANLSAYRPDEYAV
jgi:dTDP-glucose 4,6-dehydratase